MTAIYLVCGSSGEYSDRTDWTVKGIHHQEAAEAVKATLQGFADKSASLFHACEYEEAEAKRAVIIQEWRRIDAVGCGYWDATTYSVNDVELEIAE